MDVKKNQCLIRAVYKNTKISTLVSIFSLFDFLERCDYLQCKYFEYSSSILNFGFVIIGRNYIFGTKTKENEVG